MVFLGRFFEVIIGARPDPLWRLLSKVGLLYALEPVLTVIFVVNLNTVWEKVMSTLAAQIFRRGARGEGESGFECTGASGVGSGKGAESNCRGHGNVRDKKKRR